MHIKSSHLIFSLAAAAAVSAFAAPIGAPLALTKGEMVDPPTLDKDAFTVEGPLEAIKVPVKGWRVAWKQTPEEKADPKFMSGVKIVETNQVLRGAVVPALRLELTKGSWYRRHPLITLDFPVNATDYNILSFTAKVDIPEKLRTEKASRILGDCDATYTGWYSFKFNEFFDNFGVGAYDGHFNWASYEVTLTHFLTHDFPASRTVDGFTDFAWDMYHGFHDGNKGIAIDRIKELHFHYDTRKIPEGEKIVITIANPKLVKGAHVKYDEPALYQAWLDFKKNYCPDYSRSEHFLRPGWLYTLDNEPKVFLEAGKNVPTPKAGILKKPIDLIVRGKPAEIVVDLSDDIFIDNFVKLTDRDFEAKAMRGYEITVARYGAFFLQEWLKKITDFNFPVLLKPTTAKTTKIFLGATFAKDLFPEDIKALGAPKAKDGYAVRVKDGNIYIFGVVPAGTLYGIKAFLENNTDIIWAMPGNSGTVYTKNRNPRIVWGDAISTPVFIQRSWGNFSVGYAGGTSEIGRIPMSGGHYFCPQYYNKSEGINDYNPIVNGKRVEKWREQVAQACINREGFDKWAGEIVPNIINNRYAKGYYANYTVFGPDDNYGVCECAECTKPIKTKDGRWINPKDNYNEFYCAWFYNYLNKLADKIAERDPGFLTSTYAYFFCAYFPPIEVSKNIAPMLCTYVRKSQNDPIYAPVNQHWWQMYKDWAAHDDRLQLYDYYGLFLMMKPIAEVIQADAKAQASIGFLRNYTEGNPMGINIGAQAEGWVTERIFWNPDVNVEQLRRYYNRRTYREAAPWMDKFFGKIRESYYKNHHRTIDFEEQQEIPCMIADLGIEAELKGYLQEALKAVRHPTSKILIERTIKDFDAYMEKQTFSLPSDKERRVREPKVEIVFKDYNANYTNLFTLRNAMFDVEMANGNREAAMKLFEDVMNDRRMEDGKLNRFFSDRTAQLIATFPEIDAPTVSVWVRKYLTPNGYRSAGYSTTYMGNYFGVVNNLAKKFAERGDIKAAVELYDDVVLKLDDPDTYPIGLYCARLGMKVDFLRSLKKPEITESYLKRAVKVWRAALERTVEEGSCEDERYGAYEKLMLEDWDKLDQDERLDKVQTLVSRRFLSHENRRRNAERIPSIFMTAEGTNWMAMAEQCLKAVKAGDWSSLPRNTYFMSGNKDLRLNFILKVANQMIDAKQNVAAKFLLEQGGAAVGLYADTDPNTQEPAMRKGSVGERLKLLDEVIAKCGAKRLPSPKK